MAIVTKGTALIRHKDTEEEYTIDPSDLDWDTQGEDRAMGPEFQHHAYTFHPDLGDLTWDVWEYPAGAIGGPVEHKSDGHQLVRDFKFELADEEGDPDE